MTISSKYIDILRQVHNDKSRKSGFGGKVKDLGHFYYYFETHKPNTVLDYGCGKGAILSYLKEKYPNILFEGYDPAVPMFSDKPTKVYDCVFCNDVLEHIEPDFLQDVLIEINNFSNSFIWLRIDTKPARKRLPDGRNAHLILESKEWWYACIQQHIQGNIVYANLDKKGKFDVAITK